MFVSTLVGFAQNKKTHALIGVDIFNGKSNDLLGMTIPISGNKIIDIFKTGSKPISDSINKMVLTGHYIIPGLIYTHLHMGMHGLSRSLDASRKKSLCFKCSEGSLETNVKTSVSD
jgi:adenine deaminase